jgi:hypothetical protein
MKYIFGYGSLLLADGINGRGMYHTYTDDELHEATLNGYERRWNAYYAGFRYLGLGKKDDCQTNGVLFKITDRDLPAFKRSEHIEPASQGVYTLDDVTKKIDSNILQPDDKVFTCVTVYESRWHPISFNYNLTIRKALKIRGPKFNFLTKPDDVFRELWNLFSSADYDAWFSINQDCPYLHEQYLNYCRTITAAGQWHTTFKLFVRDIYNKVKHL